MLDIFEASEDIFKFKVGGFGTSSFPPSYKRLGTSLIFDKCPDGVILPQPRPNQTFYRKLYFIELVQNSLRFNMGIICFSL
jgi:hypothetical protein